MRLLQLPDGADFLPALNSAIAATGFSPAVIFSAIGFVRRAHLRVPVDAVVDAEILAPDAAPFGVQTVEDWDFFSDGRPIASPTDPPPLDEMPPIDFTPRPHWFTEEVHDAPLALLYAHGGMSRPGSKPNYHVILSGNAERPGGRAETYVGQVRPGTIVHGCVWVAVGLESAHYRGSNVDVSVVSVEIGEDVLEVLQRFLQSPRAANIGRCFLFGASGMLKRAKFRVPVPNDSGNGDEEVGREASPVADANALVREESPGVYLLDEQPDGSSYSIESMTAIFGGDQERPRMHAAIILPPVPGELEHLSQKGESVGGELLEAVVGGDIPLDLCIGEVHEDLREFEF